MHGTMAEQNSVADQGAVPAEELERNGLPVWSRLKTLVWLTFVAALQVSVGLLFANLYLANCYPGEILWVIGPGR